MELDRYLWRREGVDAELYVEPTPEQMFWVRRFGWLFAPSPEEERGLARWFGIFFVVPSTNVTNTSLQYQSYLNDIFHQTWGARIAHFVCMPLITLGLLAMLPSPLDALAAVGLAIWYLGWGVFAGNVLWGVVMLPLVAVLAALAHAFPGPAWEAGIGVVLLSFVQAASHGFEARLPPRVTRTPHWIAIPEYLSRPGERVRRLGHIVGQAVFGTFDELVASPRLFPVNILEVLWSLGYRPDQRQAWKALSARAIASGNPALDYIGSGGGTTLRAP